MDPVPNGYAQCNYSAERPVPAPLFDHFAPPSCQTGTGTKWSNRDHRAAVARFFRQAVKQGRGPAALFDHSGQNSEASPLCLTTSPPCSAKRSSRAAVKPPSGRVAHPPPPPPNPAGAAPALRDRHGGYSPAVAPVPGPTLQSAPTRLRRGAGRLSPPSTPEAWRAPPPPPPPPPRLREAEEVARLRAADERQQYQQ